MGPSILLLDNGSLEPAATLALRETARQLGAKIGLEVEPASALHSNAVPPADLDGRPAEILEEALEKRAADGATDFLIVPLFFGPSGLLTEYVPKVLRRVLSKYSGLAVRVAQPLVDPTDVADDRIARILEERVRSLIGETGNKPAVILVDHGSPSLEVTAVRNRVAAQLSLRLRDAARAVQPASMERRPGPAYSFNDPLLAAALDLPDFHSGTVIVALLFLAPGRHAGPGGDIDQICAAAERKHPGLRILKTAPLGNDPVVIEILADRVRTLLAIS